MSDLFLLFFDLLMLIILSIETLDLEKEYLINKTFMMNEIY